MSMVTEELKQNICQYLQKMDRSLSSRDIAKGLKAEKHLVDKAVFELIDEGRAEYVSFGGITCIKLVEKGEKA